ncbi:MAG: OmpA family protein [Methylomonas sp.]
MTYRLFTVLIVFSLPILFEQNARAEQRVPETDEIVQSLKLKAPAKPKSLDRSWPTRGISVEPGAKNPAFNLSTIDLAVPFDFNSAQLNTDAQLILERLGRALNSAELRSQHFKITGHTDAVGAEAYNFDLSKRRALSVQEYLVQRLHIGGDRLETDGKGFSQLYDVQHPTSAVNRRVQILNMGS